MNQEIFIDLSIIIFITVKFNNFNLQLFTYLLHLLNFRIFHLVLGEMSFLVFKLFLNSTCFKKVLMNFDLFNLYLFHLHYIYLIQILIISVTLMKSFNLKVNQFLDSFVNNFL